MLFYSIATVLALKLNVLKMENMPWILEGRSRHILAEEFRPFSISCGKKTIDCAAVTKKSVLDAQGLFILPVPQGRIMFPPDEEILKQTVGINRLYLFKQIAVLWT